MRRERRLTRPEDFAALRRRKGLFERLLVLVTRPNGLCVSRFGFSVGKGVGNAVTRNRVKRRLREAVRSSRIEEGWDVLFIARSGAAATDYHALRRSVSRLLKRSGVMVSNLE